MKVNKTTPVHSFTLASMTLSGRAKRAIFRGVWERREPLEGETPPATFSHLKNPEVYQPKWEASARPGADDAFRIKSQGV